MNYVQGSLKQKDGQFIPPASPFYEDMTSTQAFLRDSQVQPAHKEEMYF